MLTALTWNGTGNTTAKEYYLWDGDSIVEKRLGGSASANITAKYFKSGFQAYSSGTFTGNYFYTKDHLGSIREVVANDGTTVEGRFSYGPWGETTYLDNSGGTVAEPQFGYGGYFQTAYLPGLYLLQYRLYDSGISRWLSRDPDTTSGALNAYLYVMNDPVNQFDPSGLVNMNLFGMLSDPQFWWWSENFIDSYGSGDLDSAAYSVAAHGWPDGLEVGNSRTPIGPDQLASMIQADPVWVSANPKPPVQLWACSAGGQSANIAGDFAQRLANKLCTTVVAATDEIEAPHILISPEYIILNGGSWQSFFPNGQN
jgi:RHS repeat-associated protein